MLDYRKSNEIKSKNGELEMLRAYLLKLDILRKCGYLSVQIGVSM